ncbi:MAG: hypothetical protein VX252_15740 [Myxococcota bacterium]|nr:hypothetical protein [Myxococcota bacterium]
MKLNKNLVTRRFCIQIAVLIQVMILQSTAIAETPQRALTTIVGATSSADGSSQIDSQTIEECILQIPTASELEPVVNAKSRYLKMINGNIDDNRSVRTYSAEIDLTYVIYRKRLVVVTTSSIEKSEPVFKEVDGRFDETQSFVSNSENGNAYAGREYVHDYYFSTAEAAIDDVMKRAKAWLKQKQSVMCKPS